MAFYFRAASKGDLLTSTTTATTVTILVDFYVDYTFLTCSLALKNIYIISTHTQMRKSKRIRWEKEEGEIKRVSLTQS